MTTPLVVGLGNADRGDDAVGGAVARAVATAGPPTVRVVEHDDPTALIDLWVDHDPVIVVDAVISGAPAGTIHRLETGSGAPAILEPAWSDTGRGGSHAFGLAAAVELARALHRLPLRLVIIGVEADSFEPAAALSGPVAAAVDPATAIVLDILREVSVDVAR